MRISRRLALLGGFATAVAPRPSRASPGDDAEWSAFKGRFLEADGRIVDTGNGGISHSEGQGWGLFLAATFDDRPAFQRILDWTRSTLRRPHDTLHAWRYVPAPAAGVDDLNNATDGDLFIGAALARAARRWGSREYADMAGQIGRDIQRLLVRSGNGRTLLLPGVMGFEKEAAWIINPSYYAFPFVAELAEAAPSPVWQRLRDGGLALIEAGRFGPRQLPPDWLAVERRSGDLSCAPGRPARFSYDAIRIPLYVAWARVPASGLIRSLVQFWSSFPDGTLPAWADLTNGGTAPYPASPGMVAVAQLVLSQVAGAPEPAWPAIAESPDYYSSVVTMLARVAWRESGGSSFGR